MWSMDGEMAFWGVDTPYVRTHPAAAGGGAGLVCVWPYINLLYRANGLDDAQIGVLAGEETGEATGEERPRH